MRQLGSHGAALSALSHGSGQCHPSPPPHTHAHAARTYMRRAGVLSRSGVAPLRRGLKCHSMLRKVAATSAVLESKTSTLICIARILLRSISHPHRKQRHSFTSKQARYLVHTRSGHGILLRARCCKCRANLSCARGCTRPATRLARLVSGFTE